MDQSPVDATLFSYDLLLHLFENIRLCGESGSSTLASCTRVCRAWGEPASYVLWRDLASFSPLWNLLAGRDFSGEAKYLSAYWQYIDPEDFVKDVVERQPERWKRFLRRASHVREIGAAACQKSELAFIRVLTKYNGGQTFLPSLQRLSWRHAVPTDTAVLLLASQSLQDLEMSVSRLGSESTGSAAFATPQRYQDYHDVDPVFVGLAAAAPSLARFSVAGREGPGLAMLPSILELTHLRELCLFNQSLVLSVDHLRSIFASLESLESLFARIGEFNHTGLPVHAPNLLELRLQGSSKDLCGVLSGFLDTPHLRVLSLKSVDGDYSQMDHHIFPLIASATFARSLRIVSVVVLNDPSEVVWNDPTATSPSYSAIIRPLLGLPDLEDVEICLANAVISCGDEDFAEIARAWKHIQSLCLAYSPIGSRTRPPLTSLQHFADHCPQLRQLAMTKLTIPDDIEVPSVARSPPHPLMYLDLKMTLAVNLNHGRLEKTLLAQYINHLFPNLVLRDAEVLGARRPTSTTPHYFTWGAVEQEIREIRSQRLSSRDAELAVATE
ncbi:hypothetical protein K466DRAFT_593507 [Polyporus arcularius HHB13444]|uniref:F-box domain-containing protein n=1 Tax=Polyporus arcularius HHB13444 TaxID=1314778 RepID=A0A5C3PXD5_9APHY|nr:hypothetical protein K466DRAFT_593507 [Polyporus arcularius HHB13444]